jgi:O-succinylbenzoic acid--CoA ligase
MPFLSYALTAHAQAPALDDGVRARSYGELHREAAADARRLKALGVVPGERVAIRGEPGAEMVVALHGAWMAGGAVTVFHASWTGEEEARALRLLAPRVLLLVGEKHPEGAARSLGPREVRTVGIHRAGPVPALEAVEPDLGLLPDGLNEVGGSAEAENRTAAAVLTSGTSGAPKIVTLTIGNLLASSRGATRRLGLRPGDVWYSSLSPAHVGGLVLIARTALVGSALVARGSFRMEAFLDSVSSGAISHASLVPTMLHHLVEAWEGPKAPESLRCLLVGGARTQADLLERSLGKGFPVALTYGLTEASSQVATASPGLVREKPGTVGAPLPGVNVRVASGGEILVQGPTVAPGRAGEDGWLRTGDLGEQDPDGHLWITGRLSERIVSGGVTVDPVEVENTLRSHPGVEDAVVLGLPDEVWGERIVAAVARGSGSEPDPEELRRLVRTALSPAKRPRSFLVLDGLPLNPSGKVDRERVRRFFQ